ncbi:unnamed protein product [Ambrosiozyma monospora]|uniref:Unnamed protein product n=1 Tax=Ambrosiozyma monospora TaxID=43982 RepID=A0ACB5SYW2_AMBMO|nr:unnamed protein product [Ambrosiozyma monospora]
MLFINRTVLGFLVTTSNTEARDLLFTNAYKCVFEVLENKVIDIDASRVALGVVLSTLNVSFGKDKIIHDNEMKSLQLLQTQVMNLLCKIFNRYYEYCHSEKLAEPKRVYTQLFPSVYPFPVHTIDSNVPDEAFCEILIEFTVVVSWTCIITLDCQAECTNMVLNGIDDIGLYHGLRPYVGGFMEYVTDPNKPVNNHRALKRMTHPDYYPGSKWISLKAFANEAGQHYLAEAALFVQIPPLDKPELFTKELQDFWIEFFSTNLRCATSKVASIEHLCILTKRACYNITGDIRTRVAEAVERTWLRFARKSTTEEKKRFGIDEFDGYQSKLITDENVDFFAELLLFALQRNSKCLHVGMELCYNIICASWIHEQDLYELEREGISALYNVFLSPDRYTPEPADVRNVLSTIQKRSVIDVEDEAYHPAMKFINILGDFMREAIQLKAIPAGPEFDDFRTFIKLRISSYLMNVDKPELLQSLINNMFDLYLSKNDYAQAALSLQLLADTYNWDPVAYLPACESPTFPAQSEFKRKEALYTLMARKFVKGNRLEQAVECYDELLKAYKDYNFDLSGLSFCHGELCKVFKSLETVGRIDPSYFMVHYYQD